MLYSDIEQIFDEGHKELIATLVDGSIMNLRLFKGQSGDLGYLNKGSSRRGQYLKYLVSQIESVKIKKQIKKLSGLDAEIDNLKKFKKAYTEKLHPNLWSDLREGYTKLNIEKFIEFFEKNNDGIQSQWHYLREYANLNNIHIITENNYKTTTIKSNAPKGYWRDPQYDACIENIKKHLDNKETFNYYWQSNYDVSVSGKLCEDGVYRAWFSLEYRGCGNGHYYLLINENQAIFAEDD
jgi:hypothetical protein